MKRPRFLPFSLHTIIGSHELAIAFGRSEDEEPQSATSVVSETELGFGFCAPELDDEELPEE